MDANTALMTVVLGAFLGIVGQCARVIVGLKKERDKATASNKDLKELFDWRELLVSIMIGGVAGSLAVIAIIEKNVDREFLLAVVAAGYSGTDFIEGLLLNKVPTTEGPTPGT